MGEFLKKQWAVCIVALVFIAMILYVAQDTNKQKLPSKKVGNQDVVFSISDQNITADALYENMFSKDSTGIAAICQQIQKAVIEQSVETTDDIRSEAQIQADYTISQYKNQYGDDYVEYLDRQLKGMGYESADDLTNYFIFYLKSQDFLKNYINENLDKYASSYIEEKNPCIVSHILIKMDDPENPTDEDKARMKEVDDLLAKGTEFKDIAYEHSDDSSASNYGVLGYADKDTNFVTEFLNTMLDTKEGEISEWFMSQYGYHRIYINSRNVEDFKEYDEFYNALQKYTPTLSPEAIWNTAQELGITFTDEDLQSRVLNYMGLGEK